MKSTEIVGNGNGQFDAPVEIAVGVRATPSKTISRFAVLFLCIIAIAGLSRCGGGSSESPLSITTPSLPNGTAGTAYSQTIHASGGSGPFSWSLSSGSLPHNLSLSTSTGNSVSVSGTPDTAAQSVAFMVRVTDSSQHSADRSYTISILPQPDDLGLAPANLDFPPQLIASASSAQTETLTNNGPSAINIASIAITGTNVPDFVRSNNTCGSSLDPGANCTFDIKFLPADLGPRSASISINDDTGGSPQSVPLTGIGVTSGPNATLSAQSLSFTIPTNSIQSLTQTITLSNYGSLDLNVSGVTITNGFSQNNQCMPVVATGTSCTISITFAPSTTGNFNGHLTVNDDAPGGVQTVSLQGTVTTGTPTLTGHCWGTVNNCSLSSAADPTECPVGAPAIEPDDVTGLTLCGLPYDMVPIDDARACKATNSNGQIIKGYCRTN
jgi:putative Ig domain-containing protein/HYDIN/CFA65/VesB family protein